MGEREMGEPLSDIPGDPGSQLPYQDFPPYYLHPIRLVFSHWRSSWVLGFAWMPFLSVLLATHIAGLARVISSLSQSTFQVFIYSFRVLFATPSNNEKREVSSHSKFKST